MDYLLIGHVTADLKHGQRVLGGTVSYSSLVARAFGNRVAIVTSCAPDEPLLKQLISKVAIVNHVAEHTSTFENVYTENNRVQTLHRRANSLVLADIPSGWLSTPLVHLAPLTNEIDSTLLGGFPNSKVLLTPQGLMRQWDESGRVRFKYWCDRELLKTVDIVVFSKQDIQEMPEIEQEYAEACENLVVTDGHRGGVYYHYGVAQPYVAYPANEVDPTGAGDVFATCLLASLPRVQQDISKAIQIAARVAAYSVEHVGVFVPTKEKIEYVLNDIASEVNDD
jgi:sugar/nucleoside kinase (ribokinase family)